MIAGHGPPRSCKSTTAGAAGGITFPGASGGPGRRAVLALVAVPVPGPARAAAQHAGDEEERKAVEAILGPFSRLGEAGRGSWHQLAGRVALGVLVAFAGVLLLKSGHGVHGAARVAGGILLFVGGVAVVFGPWWLRLARDLVEERQARVRAEERADMAARIHDSVLQTLALIQRQAGDPHQVVRLARAQERELRSWLFGGKVPGAVADDDATVQAAVERIQRDVEAAHGVPVEAVVVGDAPLDDDLRALVEAGREATVNSAKWSGASSVSLFVEVNGDGVSMFVRDRGRGFDPEAVPPDRKGLAESIRGRMTRHGGSATVRSTSDEGTEVALTMARRS